MKIENNMIMLSLTSHEFELILYALDKATLDQTPEIEHNGEMSALWSSMNEFLYNERKQP